MSQDISTIYPGKILCGGCKKKCRGDVLRVGDRYFHKGCFKCSICKLDLETGGFFMREDNFYCQGDYQKHFVAKCTICRKDLVGEIVTVMDYSFHRDCFICTGCSITFQPGDRVTIWQEHFFCPKCIIKHGPSTARGNGLTVSTNTDEDDEGCYVSAADASLSDVASPPTAMVPILRPAGWPGGGTSHPSLDAQLSSSHRTIRQQTAAVCINSQELPKQSKSIILRKSATDQNGFQLCPTSNECAGYLSTDSGLGERFGDSAGLGDKHSRLDTDGRQNGTAAELDQAPMLGQQSRPVQQQQLQTHVDSRKAESLARRVPNSDYGRFLNHSYLNLTNTQSSAPTEKDKYHRSISSSHVNGFRKSQHFHVPERKPRFSATTGNTHSGFFGRSLSTALHQVTNSTSRGCETGTANGLMTRQGLANSAVELSRRSSKPSPSARFNDSSTVNSVITHTSTLLDEPMRVDHGKEEFTLETKRLAAFPSGQQRDPAQPPPIERYDWPAPPASAVVLAELMRERRHRRQTGDHSAADEHDDDSQDALSIDYQLNFTPGSNHHINGHLSSSGIGQAILKEDSQQKRLSRSQHVMDPVSASRSPNAAAEPHHRTRFTTHQFTCHSLRPGYTGGQLTEMQKATNSLPASSLALSGGRIRTDDIDWTNAHPTMPLGGKFASTVLSTSLHGISGSPNLSDTSQNRTLWPFGGADRVSKRRSTMGLTNLTYPSVIAPPAPSTVIFHKCQPPPPPKIIPFEQLKAYKNNAPKGIDGTLLETYLSDDEFHQIFHLSKPIFYRLPEWKRNDLKQRAGLF